MSDGFSNKTYSCILAPVRSVSRAWHNCVGTIWPSPLLLHALRLIVELTRKNDYREVFPKEEAPVSCRKSISTGFIAYWLTRRVACIIYFVKYNSKQHRYGVTNWGFYLALVQLALMFRITIISNVPWVVKINHSPNGTVTYFSRKPPSGPQKSRPNKGVLWETGRKINVTELHRYLSFQTDVQNVISRRQVPTNITWLSSLAGSLSSRYSLTRKEVRLLSCRRGITVLPR